MGEKQTNKQTATTKNQKASNNSGGSSHGAHTPFYLLLVFFMKYKNIFAVSQEYQAAPCLLGLAAAARKKGRASVPRTMVSLTGNIPNQNYKSARVNKAGVNLKLFYTLFY